jgi:serine/threonine protein kinase
MSDPIHFDPPEPSELSALLKGYEVTSLVATGGMGAVYKATQLSLDRDVAVKLLPKELGTPAFREQFQAEARAMAKLNHVNLIGIYDFGEAQGMPYIVMEFVPGKSLYYSSYGKAIDQTAAIEIISGICRGLAHAHDGGIIHRDIKPANILLDPKARPKIGDFGLASATDLEGEDDGVIYGTPGYAAPEILASSKAIGVPSDIYAVGIILYELLTGKMPEEPASPPSTVSRCDSRLDAIFKKATRRNPELRYQNANEMADDLEKLLPNLGSDGRRTIRTGADRDKPAHATLKRRLTTDSSAPSAVSSSKPKLVPLKAGESPPQSRLKPLPEKDKDDAQIAAAPVAPAAVAVETGSNWPIIRNFLIIAALIPAIIFTWGLYKKKQERLKVERDAKELTVKNNDAEQTAKDKIAQREREEREAEAAAAKARREQFEKERMAAAAAEAAKTPMEFLAEFRGNLLSGRRDQFPKGTIDRSTHFLFFVKTPMTWSEAAEFAEDHGGFLATPSKQADLDALTKRMDGDMRRIWLGGGALGREDWGWISGEPWTFDKPSTTLGYCASVSDSGVIKARPNAEQNPFVIQWTRDGSNPGSLASQLERLVPTLDSPSPAWPPTTVAHENRRFLLVNKSVSWEEADLVAASGEGHLAVVSKPLEGIFIRNFLKSSLPRQQSIWLGGELKDGNWTWSTGEPWTKATWAPNSPDGGPSDSALRYVQANDEAGWDDANPAAGNTEGFLIEWSKDAESSNATVANPGAAAGGQLSKLRMIARRFITKEIADYNKALIANKDNFIWRVNDWFGLLSKNFKVAHQSSYEALEGNLPEDGHLTGKENLGNLPAKVQALLAASIERQIRREKDFNEKMETLRKNYLVKLLAMKDKFEKDGLKTQVDSVQAEIEAMGQDVAGFRAHFGE